MTAPARITKADMDRAARFVKNAGFENARIVFRVGFEGCGRKG